MKIIKYMLYTIMCLFFTAVLIGLVWLAYQEDEKYISYYEYIDLDNNKGKARYCSYKFEHIKSGGQGSPVCELYDGTIIQVKQYKYIKKLKGSDKE